MKLLETESYSDVLAKGRRRKRPKLSSGVTDLSSLIATAEVKTLTYENLTCCFLGVGGSIECVLEHCGNRFCTACSMVVLSMPMARSTSARGGVEFTILPVARAFGGYERIYLKRGRNTYGVGEGDSNVSKAWEESNITRSRLFDKGQSKRIWAELYKVKGGTDSRRGEPRIHWDLHCNGNLGRAFCCTWARVETGPVV